MKLTIEPISTQPKIGELLPGTVITHYGDLYVILQKSSLTTHLSDEYSVPVMMIKTMEFNGICPTSRLYTLHGKLEIRE